MTFGTGGSESTAARSDHEHAMHARADHEHSQDTGAVSCDPGEVLVSAGPAAWECSGDALHVSGSGRVGIGTNAPDSSLHVRSEMVTGILLTADSDDGQSRLVSVSNRGEGGAGFAMANDSGAATDRTDGISRPMFSLGVRTDGKFHIVNSNDLRDDEERLTVTQGGRVGVGTSEPGATLHVAGTARVDGWFQITNYYLSSPPDPSECNEPSEWGRMAIWRDRPTSDGGNSVLYLCPPGGGWATTTFLTAAP